MQGQLRLTSARFVRDKSIFHQIFTELKRIFVIFYEDQHAQIPKRVLLRDILVQYQFSTDFEPILDIMSQILLQEPYNRKFACDSPASQQILAAFSHNIALRMEEYYVSLLKISIYRYITEYERQRNMYLCIFSFNHSGVRFVCDKSILHQVFTELKPIFVIFYEEQHAQIPKRVLLRLNLVQYQFSTDFEPILDIISWILLQEPYKQNYASDSSASQQILAAFSHIDIAFRMQEYYVSLLKISFYRYITEYERQWNIYLCIFTFQPQWSMICAR